MGGEAQGQRMAAAIFAARPKPQPSVTPHPREQLRPLCTAGPPSGPAAATAATEPGHHTLGALALPLLGCPLKATGHELRRPLAGPTFKEQKDQLVLSLGNSLNFWGPQFPFS